MSGKCGTSWKRSARGMTLIEAVAGTALLGTLLVTILVARAKLTAQGRRAELRIEACRLADELLESWWPDRRKIPRNGTGRIPGPGDWRWRTRVVDNRAAEEMDAEVIALEILAPGSEDGRDTPPVRVEILLPGRKEAP